MATQTTVRLIDDLDGSEAVETVGFTVDGKDYEIDLSGPNAAKLRLVLAEYVGAARRAQPVRQARGTSSAASTADKQRNQEIREWARGQGLRVSDRGRIPAEVLEAHADSQRAPAEPEVPDAPPVELDTSDTAIKAWWTAQGRPAPKRVTPTIRAQYRSAFGAA